GIRYLTVTGVQTCALPIFADGGDGNDTYIVQSGGSTILTDSGGIDSIDLGGAAFAIALDLGSSEPQLIDTAGTQLTLNGTFENRSEERRVGEEDGAQCGGA